MFFHRREWTGMFISFCGNCFFNVAESRQEEELAEAERLHVCDESQLEQFGSFSETLGKQPREILANGRKMTARE